MFGWLVAAAAVAFLIWRDPAGTRKPKSAPVDASVPVVATTDASPMSIDAGVAAVDTPEVDAPIDAPPVDPLYTVTDALDDIAASPLVFIGTGEGFGNASIHACAYRNARVIVVYEYCTAKEMPALGLIVVSPTRGYLKIYAEADSAISTLKRADYQTFRTEVEPPLEDEPFKLSFTYAELTAWDRRRYDKHGGACWYANSEDSCSGGLTPRLPAWSESAKTFIDDPPESWYALAKDLHARAVRDLRK